MNFPGMSPNELQDWCAGSLEWSSRPDIRKVIDLACRGWADLDIEILLESDTIEIVVYHEGSRIRFDGKWLRALIRELNPKGTPSEPTQSRLTESLDLYTIQSSQQI